MAFSRRKTPARPRGFGFVEVATAGGADAAVERFDGKGPGGRAPTVGEARPRVERGGGGCYGGGGGGRGGYGGGGGYGVGGGGNREPRRRKEVGGGR